MKCKACNGTGYVTACVYESDETGFIDKNYECAVCHGTGQIEQTNEEWLRSCNTEQLIEFLEKITDPHVGYLVGYWEMWLKQPHTNEVKK